jgi:hypothetical protein
MDVFAILLGAVGWLFFLVAAVFYLGDVFVLGLILVYIAAIFLVCLSINGMRKEAEAQRRNLPLPPGMHFRTVWSGKFGMLYLILALLITGGIAGELEGWAKIIPLLFVNLIMQPFCLACIALGIYAVGQALRGRFTYAFKVIPAETIPASEYRLLLRYRIFSGIVGFLFGCGLSYLCLMPLL